MSSSLGARGATGACELPGQDNKAHLLTRGLLSAPPVGFLAWDGGTSDVSSSAIDALASQVIAAVGDSGCEYPASLEAVYRFLSDPEPFSRIVFDWGRARRRSGRTTPSWLSARTSCVLIRSCSSFR